MNLRPFLVSIDRAFKCYFSRRSADAFMTQSRSCRTQSPDAAVTFDGVIPVKQLQFNYSLSSGPGGQNVQKNATKVEVRFHVDSAAWLSDEVKKKFREKHSLTKDGFFVAKSESTRSQALNQADAVEKLRQAIFQALQPESTRTETEEEKEIRRLQELGRNRKRLKDKRIQSTRRSEKRSFDW